MLELVASDAQARAEALDPTRSFIVQAPAGSGKTELLTQRYLVLLGVAEEPEEVAAITFTRKAAAEMRARVLNALESAAQKNEPATEPHKDITHKLATKALARDRERGWNLLQNPSRLRIQTIDSLCSAIARSAPLNGGSGSLGEPVDRADELYLEAARRTVRELAGSNPELAAAIRLLLLHVDAELNTLQDLIAAMLGRRDQWLRHIPPGPNPAELRAQVDATLRQVIRRALSAVRQSVPRHLASRILDCVRHAAQQTPTENLRAWAELRDFPAAEPEDHELWLGLRSFLLTAEGDWRKAGGVNRKSGFVRGTRECSEMMSLLDDAADEVEFFEALRGLDPLPPLRFDDSQWHIAEALLRVLPRAVEHLQAIFVETGKTDFCEVARAAILAVRSNEKLAARIRHLLVDEYQDTSVTQQQLFELLTARWRDGDGHTLLLVGDPMQSIYRFRQAEVGVFLQARSTGIGNLHPKPLLLRSNFRSRPAVVDWINSAFAQIFPAVEDAASGGIQYAESRAERTKGGTGVVVHPFVSIKDDGRDHDAEEAECVAEIIAVEQRRKPDCNIAVLVRARTHLARIVPELRRRGIAFRAVEIESLAECQIVSDLVALTRALLHVGDRLSWLAVLRAPWCGVTVSELEAICGEHPDVTIFDLLGTCASRLGSEARQRITRVHNVFSLAMAERGRRRLSELIEGTWIALGGPACASEDERANAEAYFTALAELERGGDIANWQQFDTRIKMLFSRPSARDENSVQLMTIHKAKGLEFDVVIIPQLGARTRGPDPRLLVWTERATESGTELLFAPIKPTGSSGDPLYQYVEHVEREREAQETRRLAYVAVTRARENAHLLGCASASIKRDGVSVKPEESSLLACMWPALEPIFQQKAEEVLSAPAQTESGLAMAASAESRENRYNVIRRLPADWKLPQAPDALPAVPILAATVEPITFDWSSDLRRHIGTVTHVFLQQIARVGLERWKGENVVERRKAIRAALTLEGVSAQSDLDTATAEVEKSLINILEDERGRWCLAAHDEAETELSLSGVVAGAMQHIRIDRTFVLDGVRWIIDYKTGTRQGGRREEFLDNEVRRYKQQMECYAELMSHMDPRPISIGLYFPLERGWREWAPKAQSSLPLSSSAVAP